MRKARRDLERQLDRRISADPQDGRLRREQSVRDQFFRRHPRRSAETGNRRKRALSRPGRHGIQLGRAARRMGKQQTPSPSFMHVPSKTSSAPGFARSNATSARRPRRRNENRDAARPADANGDPAARLAELTHLYFTEQPYGFVFALETALPASDSSRATFT